MAIWSIFVVACGLLSLVVAQDGNSALTAEKSKAIIQQHLRERYTSAGNVCDGNNCCTVSSSEKCSIGKFPKDESTLVFPGGSTRCIFSYSTPFAFQVIPGDSDKLLFYFQGGGACWDQGSTTVAPLCSTDISPQSAVGVFDRTNENNRFRSYTIVHVLYCSGDVHGGNTTRPYNDKEGKPVVQVGLVNAQSALDWVKQQMLVGGLSKKFSELVVMGCSAGSLGVQLWSKEVLQQLSWSSAAVIPDSYAGVFPDGTEGPLFYEYGFCESGFLNTANYDKCMKQALTLEDMNLQFLSEIPTIPVSFVQSKTDIVQQSFYIAVALSMNTSTKSITPTEFYKDVNNIFGLYNQNLPNFMTYLVNGDQHCFTDQRLYYTADAISATDNGQSTSVDMMYQYVNQVPLTKSQSMSTVCVGNVQGVEGINDNTYCSSKVVPKTFAQV